MIPRIDMSTINVEAGYEELLGVFKEYMYTRIPVYQDDNDNICLLYTSLQQSGR